MKKPLLLFVSIIFLCIIVKGQCGGPILTVNNPSFEGPPQAHVTPPGWDICMPGVTPDTQPGFWGQNLPPSNGSSYIGLVYQPSSGWQEGAGQTLSSPMTAGTNYNFSIDLAVPSYADPATGIIVPPYCAQLQLWGGTGGVNSGCDQSELLWTSPIISNTTWQTYNLNFTPTQNWNHVLFLIYSALPACTDGQYLMMDNMTPIIPEADIADFIAPAICVGSTTQFTDQSSSTSGTITNWSWNFGDGSPVVNTQNTSHIYSAPGTYDVTLTIISSVPCTTSVVNQVVVYAIPTVSASANPAVTCQGLPVTLTASGATTYTWSNGLGTSNPVTAYPSGTTTYSVTGNANGCTNTASVTVNAGQLQINAAVISEVLCNGGNDGSGEVTISTGTPPYSYTWSPSGGNGPSASNLVAGTYTVSVTDSVGCQSSASIIITEPPLLSAFISDTTHVACFGASTGNATVSVSGGTQPYTYSWSPTGGTGATTTGIPAGTYMVYVTDAHSCAVAVQVIITESPEIHIELTPEDETCQGMCNGLVTSMLIGNYSQPVFYSWNTTPPQTTATATNLCPGDYTLTVTYSSHNCLVFETASINTSNPISAEFTADPIDGYVPLSVQFTYTGYGASTYNWNFGDPLSSSNTSNLEDPNHTYEYMDTNIVVTLVVSSGPPYNCEDEYQIIIRAMQPSTMIIPNIFTPNGDGINEYFGIRAGGIRSISANIYNRWGKNIYTFSATDFNPGPPPEVPGAKIWDGTSKSDGKCADGTYYYILEAVGYDKKEYNLQGTITLLR